MHKNHQEGMSKTARALNSQDNKDIKITLKAIKDRKI